jgi:hypothetical protein
MSRHLALVISKREATLKPRVEGIAWMRVLIDRANGTPASRGNDPVAVVQTRLIYFRSAAQQNESRWLAAPALCAHLPRSHSASRYRTR